jgi:hypothetical protein
MEEMNVIPKNRTLPDSQDYEFLRKEGLKHIESLSHEIWTDYNTHDPGITILEALCYAITELGYRCGFEIKDLLTDKEGELVKGQNFFTAKEILTINPLTINDYRKLVIDIEGVHNAWLYADDYQLDNKKNKQAINEVPLFADCKNDKLVLETNAFPVFLSGLYRVLIDLGQDDRLGDLNTGEIIIDNPELAGRFARGEFWFSVNLPSWKEAGFDYSSLDPSVISVNSLQIDATLHPAKGSVELVEAGNVVIPFTVNISKKPPSKTVSDADIAGMFSINDFLTELIGSYITKIQKAKKIIQTVIKLLHEHRNLCEDFLSVTTIDYERIAFCFDVDVKPEADIEKIQAEIYYAIENYLNPSVDFYPLKEMLDKKIPVDEIFNGTALTHGFIDTVQLEKTQLHSVIHTSDIINILMDIPGVIAIRNFVMTKYDESGKPVPGYTGLKWCMDITPFHKTVLSVARSKILLFKNQFPFLARYEEVHDTILVLHAQRSRSKLNGTADDLPIQTGDNRDTESYWPVQYDFPQTYGIGEYGLPSTATTQRIAQQRQLKAYLMFYEQLLADFMSQLTHLHRLFSTENIKQTYFARFLENIKDLDPVYNTALPTGQLRDLLLQQDATAPAKNGWQQLYEPRYLFEDRRGRFLDHLLARFAESFNDYATLMYSVNYQERSEEKIEFAELTSAKINTLVNYADISGNRGKAFNYFPQKNDFTIDSTQLWDTKNVSGLEKRISFLTAIKDYTRRFLYCIKNVEIVCNEIKEGDILKCYHTFTVTTLSGLTLTSLEHKIKADAEKAALEAIKSGSEFNNYLFDEPTLQLQLIGSGAGVTGAVLLWKDCPDNETFMTEAAKLAEEFAIECNDPAGLHLIEHILLRPRDAGFKRMTVCLDDCDCLCELDPYSFHASVVLPYWPGHFDSMSFRQYFENKIREEAPAHVMLKICWLNNELMRQFEIAYKAWIEKLAAYSFDKVANLTDFRKANDDMINILAKLHSEYPLATLHDCNESKEGSNVVVLGKTVLGTFKN